MAERASDREGVAVRLLAFARSLFLLAVIALGVPALLIWAARERFGGASPLHGVVPPADWTADRVGSSLTDRLTEETIADIVIRLSLVVAWVAVVVVVLTVIAEVVHMLRHDGLALPAVRGLGASQPTARVIAAGLLAVLPLLTAPAGALADGRSRLPSERAFVGPAAAAPGSDVARPRDPFGPGDSSVDAVPAAPGWGRPVVPPQTARRAPSHAPDPSDRSAIGQYVVRPGDSVFGIAERLVGSDPTEVAAFAEELVDLNLGRRMGDGRYFSNAAFIDVGWVLQLPARQEALPAASSEIGSRGVHVVQQGESLWSIADDELGDPTRWPEVYEANAGRTFDDGESLADPDLIRPGWELELPVRNGEPGAVDEALAEPPMPGEAPVVESLVEVEPAVPPGQPAEPEVPARFSESSEVDAATDAAVALPGGNAPVGQRDNVWDAPDVAPVTANVEAAGVGDHDASARADRGAPTAADDAADGESTADDEADHTNAPALLTFGSAAMLSSGVLALLAVRRRNRLRRSRPRARLPEAARRPAATERSLRAIGAGERLVRVEAAVRAVARSLVDQGVRVLACSAAADGSMELRATGPVELSAPWEGAVDTWQCAASTPLELLSAAATGVAVPCPALVQLGTDDEGRDVFVDLEAIEAIEIGGNGAQADAVVAAIAATLAGSALAEVTTLVGVGVPDDAFLDHRLYRPVRDVQDAFVTAADAVGSTASMPASTFELRVRGSAGETWEPAVVLAGSTVGAVVPPAERTGLAVVSAAPIRGPSSRLAPEGGSWTLRPAGIRLTPVGLTPSDIDAIAELVTVLEPELGSVTTPTSTPTSTSTAASASSASSTFDRSALLDDRTIVTVGDHGTDESASSSARGADEGGQRVGGPEDADSGPSLDPSLGHVGAPEPGVEPSPEPLLAHELLVRLLGPVDVVDVEGRPVTFERSKTRELVAWLATHRERSTRSAARTALWELDVRDATFANVVSEARRSLARLTEPPVGEEWVGRTMTDDLPLHRLVVTDADLVRSALDLARVQPPAQAIATLTPAVDLIVGMPFEGTSYLWPDSEGLTSNLVLLATAATTELAAHCLSVGDVEGVFRATGRGLQVLPGHEELIGLRMQAHARAGDLAGIRQEWESYERVINADPWSDGEPAPKLVELRRRLLNPSG